MRKTVFIPVTAVLAVAAAASWYVHGYYKYKSVFLPGTVINSEDVSSLSASQAEDKIRKPLQDITVHYLDQSAVISAKDMHAAASYQNGIRDVFDSQNHYLWFLGAGSTSFDVEPDLYYDVSQTAQLVQSLPFVKDYVPPKNAEIIYRNGIFSVQKEEEGTQPDAEKMEERIRESVERGIYDINADDCRILPSVTEKDLSLTGQMTAMNNRDEIEIDVGGGKTCQLGKIEFQDAVIWDGSEISADDKKLNDILSALKDEWETLGASRRFITHDSAEITVGGSVKDDFGYDMDEDAAKEVLSEVILNGGKSFQIPWKQEGKDRNNGNDFGTTYAEVSIRQQHVWYYKDGECVFDSDTVTGLPELGGTTPGVFHILYKQSPSVLKGENYSTPVTYWMPFTYTGTGFHDAYWRSKFGGTLYLTTGSHGCVNLPAEKAKELYGIIQTGDPVIVY